MQAAASHLLNVGRIKEGMRTAPAPPVGEHESAEVHSAFVAANRQKPFIERRPGWISARNDWINRS
jgi:hypothetical protein